MASIAHCCLVFDTLQSHYEKCASHTLQQYRSIAVELHSTEQLEDAAAYPLFVTYNTLRLGKEKRLRGCIGTFASQPLEDTLKHYAIVAALQDTRFHPIQHEELSTLEAAVSILTDFEEIEDPYDWTVGKHGLQVHFMYKGRGRSATFLPDVAQEQKWSKKETLDHLFRKGGWDGAGDWADLQADLERYQSTKSAITHGAYLEVRNKIVQA